jgi:ribosomal protein L32
MVQNELSKKKGGSDPRDPELERIIVELIQSGHSERETAKIVGRSGTVVHKVKEKHGLVGLNYRKSKRPMKIDEVNQRLAKYGIECVEYVGRHHGVKIRCLVCGFEFIRDGSWMYQLDGNDNCPACKEEARAIRERQRQAEKEKEQAKKKADRQEAARKREEQRRLQREAEKRKQMQVVYVCECCGEKYTIEKTGYNSKKYCSSKCQNRLYQRKHEQVRDYRKRWRKHDSGITLEKVFKQDKGVCHICGERCDWKDIRVNENGTHIAGNRYPSIDHVFPLSKGGTDTWDNVRLAHRICNSIKRDKVEEVTE